MGIKTQVSAVDAAYKALGVKVSMMTNAMRKIPESKMSSEGAQGIGGWKKQLEAAIGSLQQTIDDLDSALVEQSVHAEDRPQVKPLTDNARKRVR